MDVDGSKRRRGAAVLRGPRGPLILLVGLAWLAACAGPQESPGPRAGAVGAGCQRDEDCDQGACRPVGPGGASACVAPCRAQGDCAAFSGTYCAPTSAGSPTGYCVIESPMHCAACKADGDCGALADRCLRGPDDGATACHIDCSLGGVAACPEDYDCRRVTDGAGPLMERRLCLPRTPLCVDAQGGLCRAGAAPQPCARASEEGTCAGERSCQAGRYGACGAERPRLLQSCGEAAPAGCQLKVAPGAARSAEHCGACGNRCPGANGRDNEPFCKSPPEKLCDQYCLGESYDIDGVVDNGCELSDPIPVGHSQDDAKSRGAKPCGDDASMDQFEGVLPSDRRPHKGLTGFLPSAGSAPDYWVVTGSGGTLCQNDYAVTVTTSGGGSEQCYKLSVITSQGTRALYLRGDEQQSVSSGAGSYGSGSAIYFKLERSCLPPSPGAVVRYKVSYHL